MSTKLTSRLLAAAVLGSSLILGSAGVANAHSTGGEIRTVKACKEKLKGAMEDRCKKCITQPGKHHFHPRAQAGHRCMKNGTQPNKAAKKDEKK